MRNHFFLLITCPGNRTPELDRLAGRLPFAVSREYSLAPWCRAYLQEDVPHRALELASPARKGFSLGHPDFNSLPAAMETSRPELWKDSDLVTLGGEHVSMVVDTATRELAIWNDQLGTQLLYERTHDEMTAWSNSLRILNGIFPPAGFSFPGLVQYMAQGYLINRHSLLNDTHRVEPACLTILSGRSATRRRYWRMHFTGDLKRGPELVERYHAVLDSCADRLKGIGDLRIMLSAGLDSRFAAALLRNRSIPLHGLFFRFRGMDPSPYLTRRLARSLGVPLREFTTDPDLHFSGLQSSMESVEGNVHVNHLHYTGHMDALEDMGGSLADTFLVDSLLRGWTHRFCTPQDDPDKLFARTFSKYRSLDEAGIRQLMGDRALEWYRDSFMPGCRALWESQPNRHPMLRRTHYVVATIVRGFITYANHLYLNRAFDVRTLLLSQDFLSLALRTHPEALYRHRLYHPLLKRLHRGANLIPQNHSMLPPIAPYFLEWSCRYGSKALIHGLRHLNHLTRGKLVHHLHEDYPRYGEWIRAIPRWRDHYSKWLLRPDAGWRNHLDEPFVESYLRAFLSYGRHDNYLLHAVISLEYTCELFGKCRLST